MGDGSKLAYPADVHPASRTVIQPTVRRHGAPMRPKEHGAWAVLLGAFVAGAGIAGRFTGSLALLLIVLVGLALANGPLTVLVRRGTDDGAMRSRALRWGGLYAGAGAVAAIPLAFVHPGVLFGFAGLAVAFGVVRVWLVRRRRDRGLAGELIGVAGLSLAGPAATAFVRGMIAPTDAVLWLLLCLYFCSGVFYVRMRVRAAQRNGAQGGHALGACIGFHLLLVLAVAILVAAAVVPWRVGTAFIPALGRVAVGLRVTTPLNLRRLGWSEVAFAAGFVGALVLTF